MLSFTQRCREPHKLLKGGDISRTRTAIYMIILGYRKHGQKGLSMNIKDEFMTAQAEQPQATTAKQAQDKAQEKVSILAIQVLDDVNIFDVRDKLISEHPEYMLEECIFNIDRNEIQMNKPLTVDDTDSALEIQEYLDRKNINARVYEFDVSIEANRILVDFMMDGNAVRLWGFKGKFDAISRKIYE